MFKKLKIYFVAIIIGIMPAQANVSDVTIVVLGDSLAAGYRLTSDKGFVPKLQKALDEKGYNVKLVNAAVPGDTTTGGLARLDWSVEKGTKGVILELGANDALRGIPPQATRDNLSDVIGKLKKRNIKILMTGMMAPPNLGEEYGKTFNAIYPDLAKKYEVGLYPFFLKDVAAQPEFNLEDAIHPNEKGVEIIVKNIMPFVEQMIGKIENE